MADGVGCELALILQPEIQGAAAKHRAARPNPADCVPSDTDVVNDAVPAGAPMKPDRTCQSLLENRLIPTLAKGCSVLPPSRSIRWPISIAGVPTNVV